MQTEGWGYTREQQISAMLGLTMYLYMYMFMGTSIWVTFIQNKPVPLQTLNKRCTNPYPVQERGARQISLIYNVHAPVYYHNYFYTLLRIALETIHFTFRGITFTCSDKSPRQTLPEYTYSSSALKDSGVASLMGISAPV